MDRSCTFSLGKETKNTYRYDAPEGASIQGSLYLQKATVEGKPPETIVVSVETVSA